MEKIHTKVVVAVSRGWGARSFGSCFAWGEQINYLEEWFAWAVGENYGLISLAVSQFLSSSALISFCFKSKIVENSHEMNFSLTAGPFFSKCTFLKLHNFFQPSTYPLSSILIVVVQMYEAHVFDKLFFPFATVAMITSVFFPSP